MPRTGRPPLSKDGKEAKKMKCFRLKPCFMDRLKNAAKAKGQSQAAFIEDDPRLKA